MLRKLFSIVLVILMTSSVAMPVVAWDGSEDECYDGSVHEWSDWYVEENPTCSSPGYERRYCGKCGNYEENWLPEEEHYWVEDYEHPKCIEDGWIYRYCYECGEWEEEWLPATGIHDWSYWSTIKAATINKVGQKERYCEYCGKYQTAKIAKLKPFAKFAKKTYTLGRGKSMTMKASYAKGDKIKSWKSSKRKVATINKKGKISGKRYGATKITVTMKSGKKATCVVNVVKPSKKVYWTPLGKVYHKSKKCKTLKKSKIIKSGTIKQSKKPRACKVCGK